MKPLKLLLTLCAAACLSLFAGAFTPLPAHAHAHVMVGAHDDVHAAWPAAQHKEPAMLSCVQDSVNVITLVAPSGGVTKDVPVVIGDLCVIPETTTAETLLFAGRLLGVFELPKTTGGENDFAAGEVVQWDASAGACIPHGSVDGDFDIGYAVEAVTASATTVKVAKVIATTTVNAT